MLFTKGDSERVGFKKSPKNRGSHSCPKKLLKKFQWGASRSRTKKRGGGKVRGKGGGKQVLEAKVKKRRGSYRHHAKERRMGKGQGKGRKRKNGTKKTTSRKRGEGGEGQKRRKKNGEIYQGRKKTRKKPN